MTDFLERVLDKIFWWQLLIKTFKTSFCYYSFVIKKDKNFMVHFYGWGSTASRLEPLRGGSLLFTTKSQKFLILTLSTSEGWKAESTLEPPIGFEHGIPELGIQRLNH